MTNVNTEMIAREWALNINAKTHWAHFNAFDNSRTVLPAYLWPLRVNAVPHVVLATNSILVEIVWVRKLG